MFSSTSIYLLVFVLLESFHIFYLSIKRRGPFVILMSLSTPSAYDRLYMYINICKELYNFYFSSLYLSLFFLFFLFFYKRWGHNSLSLNMHVDMCYFKVHWTKFYLLCFKWKVQVYKVYIKNVNVNLFHMLNKLKQKNKKRNHLLANSGKWG